MFYGKIINILFFIYFFIFNYSSYLYNLFLKQLKNKENIFSENNLFSIENIKLLKNKQVSTSLLGHWKVINVPGLL